MNSKTIRIQLIRLELQLKDLSDQTGIDYDRLLKLLHGYRRPRPDDSSDCRVLRTNRCMLAFVIG